MSEFKHGLLDVMAQGPGVCCWACCCPQCVTAKARTDYDESSIIFNCLCVNPCVARSLIREGYGIKGDWIQDIVFGCCLPCCTSIQLLSEVKERGGRHNWFPNTTASNTSTLINICKCWYYCFNYGYICAWLLPKITTDKNAYTYCTLASSDSAVPLSALCSCVDQENMGEFKRGILECFAPGVGVCCLACCCPQCVTAKARTDFDESNLFFNCLCVNPCVARSLIREGYGIRGDWVQDVLLGCCLPCCTATQLFSEVHERGHVNKDAPPSQPSQQQQDVRWWYTTSLVKMFSHRFDCFKPYKCSYQ